MRFEGDIATISMKLLAVSLSGFGSEHGPAHKQLRPKFVTSGDITLKSPANRTEIAADFPQGEGGGGSHGFWYRQHCLDRAFFLVFYDRGGVDSAAPP